MSFTREALKFVCHDYWNIKKPVRLTPQPNFNGVTVTPEHNLKQVLTPSYDTECVVITPIHETETKAGTITRAFGDLLAEEVA